MELVQRQLRLPGRARGCHLITEEVVRALGRLPFAVGMAQVFLLHTSASLTINENADPTVRADMERWLARAVPDGADYFAHDDEGPDDMPAHVKSSLFGCSLLIPVAEGRLALGTWQGIWLCEHRDQAGERQLLLTAWG